MKSKKFDDGAFVTDGKLKLIVRYGRGETGNGQIFCEWTDDDSGDEKGDWFDEDDLRLL